MIVYDGIRTVVSSSKEINKLEDKKQLLDNANNYSKL